MKTMSRSASIRRLLTTTSLVLGCLTFSVACDDHDHEDTEADGDHDHDHDHDHDSEGKASGASCPSVDAPTYESFGRQFMETYCTRCHASTLAASDRQGAPLDHNLDSLEAILQIPPEHIDTLTAAGPLGVNTAMPPSGPFPSQVERELLGQWLACQTP